jgi:hypothetical protein
MSGDLETDRECELIAERAVIHGRWCVQLMVAALGR